MTANPDSIPAPPPAPRRSFGSTRSGLLVTGAVLTVVVTIFALVGRRDGGVAEVTLLYLEPVATAGADPFTPSVRASSEGVGPYGGTGDQELCDVDTLVRFLTEHEQRGRAWAAVQGLDFDGLDEFVRSLTPTVLQTDTRVTNHGYRNGRATPRQSVLQAGTAVLVDDAGVPRARCACGNPLLAPDRVTENARVVGEPWEGFDAAEHVDGEAGARPSGGQVPVGPADAAAPCVDPGGADVAEPGGPYELFVGRYDTVLDRAPLDNIRNVVRVTVFTGSAIVGFASNQDYSSPADPADEVLRIHVHGDGFGMLADSGDVSWPGGLAEPNTAPFDDAPDASDPAAVEAVIDAAAGLATGTVSHADGTVQHFTATRVAGIEGGSEGGAPADPACVEEASGAPVTAGDGTTFTGSFTAFPGALPGELTENTISLVFPGGPGVVIGTSVWTSSHPMGSVTHEYAWVGEVGADGGSVSGTVEVTVTLPDGSTTTGTGTFSGSIVGEASVTVEGTVVVDGEELAFEVHPEG